MSDTTKSAAETLTFADILEQAKPAKRTTFLYLAADLLARRDELEQEIDEAARIDRLSVRNGEDQPERSLGEASSTDTLVAELTEVLDDLRASRQRFRFQMLPRAEWDALRKRFEVSDGQADVDTMAAPLVAASLFDPPGATEESVEQLFSQLNLAQRQQLFETAWAVNTGAVDIPFSPAGLVAQKAKVFGKK